MGTQSAVTLAGRTNAMGAGESESLYMKVACIEGHWHDVTPTALAIILAAYLEGDLQIVGGKGVVPLCMSTAFTKERVIAFQQKWPGHVISFDRRNPLTTITNGVSSG